MLSYYATTMDEELKSVLSSLMKMVDTKKTMDSFVEQFGAVLDVFLKLKDSNAKDMEGMRNALGQHIASLKDTHQQSIDAHKATLSDMSDGALKEQSDGLNFIRDSLRRGVKGLDGKDGLPGRSGRDGSDGSPDAPEDIRVKLEALEGEERLGIPAVHGLQEKLDLIDGTLIKHAQRVIGTSTSLWHLSDVNVAGLTTGQSIKWDGVQWIPYTASASGSGFQVPTSGTINGINATYVWATAPNVIVVDGGRAMQKISSDGTVNWTGTTTTVLTIAPTFDVFSPA